MTFRVGITGGMGSGKSIVAAIFETLGVPVYQSDDAAKRLMNEDANLKMELIQNFGNAVYREGTLDRAFLSAAVFNNTEKLARLNAIVHPATFLDGEQWMLKQKTPYALKEAAIIFETGSQRYLDFVIGVYAPVTLRIYRSMKRGNATRQAVKARMEQQMDDDIKMKLCDAVVVNDEQQALIPQVLALHDALQQRAATNRPS